LHEILYDDAKSDRMTAERQKIRISKIQYGGRTPDMHRNVTDSNSIVLIHGGNILYAVSLKASFRVD